MGLRCNSEKDPEDGRSTNILFLIVPACRALRASPRGGEHRTPCEAETYLQATKKKTPVYKVALSQSLRSVFPKLCLDR